MKLNNLKNKIWAYFIFFSVCILSGLWLFQVAFLSSYYEYHTKLELNKIAFNIRKSYGSSNLENILDELAYQNGVCIEIFTGNSLKYSSGSVSRGCIDNHSQSLAIKKDFFESNLENKQYKIINNRFKNKTLIYALKLDRDYYIFINVSLEPLGNTTKILASQLIYVTIIVFILSFFLSYFVSKKVSFPIIKLKESAIRMSKGDYDVVFEANSDIEELDELADTLNQARLELSKKDELRREFLANVSHDLKTPLTMIKAYAEMVRDLTYNNKEKREENLNIIIDETERLNILVNDILELSKIQSDVETLRIERFDLNEIIINILNKFKYLEETKGYKFIYSKKENLIVEADVRKIEQVIYNLVSNAINYVGKDKKVIIEVKLEKGYYKVSIIDHGKGIDEKDIDHIWDKYYKVDKTHKRNILGTGLGLTIVKNVLIKHGFEYGADSKKGIGSIFYFKVKAIRLKKKEK